MKSAERESTCREKPKQLRLRSDLDNQQAQLRPRDLNKNKNNEGAISKQWVASAWHCCGLRGITPPAALAASSAAEAPAAASLSAEAIAAAEVEAPVAAAAGLSGQAFQAAPEPFVGLFHGEGDDLLP